MENDFDVNWDELETTRVNEGLAILAEAVLKVNTWRENFEYICDKRGYDTGTCYDAEKGVSNLAIALAGLVQWKDELEQAAAKKDN